MLQEYLRMDLTIVGFPQGWILLWREPGSSKDKVCRKLAKIAKVMLSMPASSTSSEKLFSLAWNTLADQHS